MDERDAMDAKDPGVTAPLPRPRRGRGALSNADGRFEPYVHAGIDDGWGFLDEELPPLATEVYVDTSRTIIARNDSPDIPFGQSINPYRGCEHGCVYCYARPSHAYLGLSPGLDFETKLFAKPEAAKLLAAELRRRGYRPSAIALGSNTDPYQPVERKLKITRAILEVLAAHDHPLTIVTKSALVARDLDLLAPMAAKRLVGVFVSVTTLDRELARHLEPRAAAPHRRLETIRMLASAGVPTGVMFAPVIPALNDHEMERVLEAAAGAGARHAGWVLLRLPHEVKALFREWLAAHAPGRAAHVMSLIHQARGGRDNDPRFGSRMRGQGPWAGLTAQRFATACRRFGLNREELVLDTARFRVPDRASAQLDLFVEQAG
jgi:DNA repair photolyase